MTKVWMQHHEVVALRASASIATAGKKAVNCGRDTCCTIRS